MNSDWGKTAKAYFEDGLRNSLNRSSSCSIRLKEAMSYALFPGGKRLRPLLTLAVADVLGVKFEAVIPAAMALEIIHCFSLVHDDLPAMDDDDYRRGRLSVHRAFDEATSILAGDALLNWAYEVAVSDEQIQPEICLLWVRELTKATGSQGMIGGQVLDCCGMEHCSLAEVHRAKTGALFACSMVLGAAAARVDLAPWRQLGFDFGSLFQLVDDIEDLEQDEESVQDAMRLASVKDLKTQLEHFTQRIVTFEPLAVDSESAMFIKDLAVWVHNRGLEYLVGHDAVS